MTRESPYTGGTCDSTFCCSQQGACNNVGEWSATTCTCTVSPVIVDTDNGTFTLMSPQEGPLFDMIPDGMKERRAWPKDGAVFFVLDRNGDGTVNDGSELFGSVTEQPPSEHRNGFLALALYDRNHDSVIGPTDPVVIDLRVWLDRNSDGISQQGELVALESLGIVSISLKYTESRRHDRAGNLFRYRAPLSRERGSPVAPQVWDVFLVGAPCVGAQGDAGPTASR